MQRRLLRFISVCTIFVLLCGYNNCFAGQYGVTAANDISTIWDGSIAEGFASGSGTHSDPYIIETPAQFAFFANMVDKGTNYSKQYIELKNNIILNDTTNWSEWENTPPINVWNPIGSTTRGFYGNFNGNGYTISGVYVNASVKYSGVFTINCGIVQNVNVDKSLICGTNSVGGIVGLNSFNGSDHGEINNCKNNGTVIGTSSVGGIAGTNYHSISFSTYTGKILATSSNAGGISGNSNTVIVNCCNTGNIKSEGGRAGGITGTGGADNCYNTGNVSTVNNYCGGIVGYNDRGIRDCYNTGTVNGETEIGGIAGIAADSAILCCYNIGEVAATGKNTNVGAIVGKISLNGAVEHCYYANSIENTSNSLGEFVECALMKQKDSFPGFDFLNSWTIEETTEYLYPQLIIHLPDSYCEKSSVWDGSVATSFSDGTGTEEDPYLIKTASELAYLAQTVNNGYTYKDEYIKLEQDIVLNDANKKYWRVNAIKWMPIGIEYPVDSSTSSSYEFKGCFDGAGHTISGIYIDNSSKYQGLFGMSDGIIKNINIRNSYIKGGSWTGSVVGRNEGSVINCSNTGFVFGTDEYIGGIIGRNFGYSYDTKVTSCYNAGFVYGLGNYVGGICGYSENSTNSDVIDFCYNTGQVYGASDCVGGITGSNNALIQNCYNTGQIYASDYAGGITGINNATINMCYNAGNVKGVYYYGGISGRNNSTVKNCYYIDTCIDDNAQNYSGTALKSEDMKLKDSFGGFDFDQVWDMQIDQFPTLKNASCLVPVGFCSSFGDIEPFVKENYEGIILVALYDKNNTFVRCDTYTPDTSIPINFNEGYLCKIMWWDSLTYIKPICASRTVFWP